MAETSEKGDGDSDFSLDQLVDAAEWAWSSDHERKQRGRVNLPVLKAVLKHASMPSNGKKADVVSRIAASRAHIERSLGTTDPFLLVCRCATGLRAGTCQGYASCTCDKQGQCCWYYMPILLLTLLLKLLLTLTLLLTLLRTQFGHYYWWHL